MSSQLLHQILRCRDRSKVGAPHLGALLHMYSPKEAVSSLRCGEPHLLRYPTVFEELDAAAKWFDVNSVANSSVPIFLR
jgi:hypothetical protein